MKTLFLFLVLLAATPSLAASSAQRALWQYPYDVRSDCSNLNSFRDRKAKYVNYALALECAKATMLERERLRQLALEEELKIAKIRWLNTDRYRCDRLGDPLCYGAPQ